MKRFRSLLGIALLDPTLERVRKNLVDAVRELQGVPVSQGVLLRDVELEDGVETPVAHGIGRRAVVLTSPPRGPSSSGRLEELRSSEYDPTRYALLKASGFGATVTVDIAVVP